MSRISSTNRHKAKFYQSQRKDTPQSRFSLPLLAQVTDLRFLQLNRLLKYLPKVKIQNMVTIKGS